jgi:putative transposase
MLKAIKIRLYPNKEQEIYINKLLGCYRKVYNECLGLKIKKYNENKENYGLKQLGKFFHNELTKKEEFSYLNEHNTKVLKQSIITLLDAYKRFFVNGSGFPKFKSKKDSKSSCRFTSEAISTRNDYLSGKLTLTKELKNLKFKCSDEYKVYLNKYKDRIKSATLTKTSSGNFFLSILVDGNIEKQLPKAKNEIAGIDLGIKNFVITSEGKTYENLKVLNKNEKKLKRLHRQLSKKQIGSKNRTKARIKLAKKHEKINNIKENYLHQVANELLNDNQVIVMEDLNVSGMLKNKKLSKSIQELSLSRFKSILVYKSNWYDRKVVEVDRWFPSSKLCSECGYKYNGLKLSERTWICPSCGKTHDRDFNAATNLKNEGKRILGRRTTESTLVDFPLMDERHENDLKSNERLKQERNY